MKSFHFKTLGIDEQNERNNQNHQAEQKPTPLAGDTCVSPTPTPTPSAPCPGKGGPVPAAALPWEAGPHSPALGNELIIDPASQGPWGEQSILLRCVVPGETLPLTGPASCSAQTARSAGIGIPASLGSV